MNVTIKDARSVNNPLIRAIGLEENLTIHYVAYYFYLPSWKNESDYDSDKIASYYGMSIDDIGTAEVTNADEFVYNWNIMGYESSGVNIKAVVINTHSNGTNLTDGHGGIIASSSEMPKLGDKNRHIYRK